MRTLARISVVGTCLVLLGASPAWAVRSYAPVQSDPVPESWRWRRFPELRGLGLNCMAEDPDGNMWFGVAAGAVRYDGREWRDYARDDGLPQGPVRSLCATPDGVVYAGTGVGIYRYAGEIWERVFPPRGLDCAIHRLVEAPDGALWASTDFGPLHIRGDRLTCYANEGLATCLRMHAPGVEISVVPSDVIPTSPWREESAVGLLAVQGVIWALASRGPAEAAGLLLGDRITEVDGKPRVIEGQLDGALGSTVALTVERGKPPVTFEVAVVREGGKGLYPDWGVVSAYEDQEGAVWFGLYNGKIVRHDPAAPHPHHGPAWQVYSEEDGLDVGLNPHVRQTSDGTIWAFSLDSRHGVNRFDGDGWESLRLRDLGGSDANYCSLETSDGAFWVGGRGAIHAFRDGEWTTYTSSSVPIPDYHITGLLESRDGALWIASEGHEAVRLDHSTSRWTTLKGLRFECETPDLTQWFITQDREVVSHANGEWKRYGIEDGLIDSPGALVATRDGELWAAGSHNSAAATARFDGTRWRLQIHRKLSQAIGSAGICESRDGSLWFGAAGTPPLARGTVRWGPPI